MKGIGKDDQSAAHRKFNFVTFSFKERHSTSLISGSDPFDNGLVVKLFFKREN
jgi:hypothetical protein